MTNAVMRRLSEWVLHPRRQVDPVLLPEGKRLTEIVADHQRRIGRLIEQQDQRNAARKGRP